MPCTATPNGTVLTVSFADSLIIRDALAAYIGKQIEYIGALDALTHLGHSSIIPASYRHAIRECWDAWRIYNNLHN